MLSTYTHSNLCSNGLARPCATTLYAPTVEDLGDVIVADRLYNVEQIAIASMGENSVLDDSQQVPCYRTNTMLT